MSKKFSEALKAAFLRALSETGNQTLAAERAKVSRSRAQFHHSKERVFSSRRRVTRRAARKTVSAQHFAREITG